MPLQRIKTFIKQYFDQNILYLFRHAGDKGTILHDVERWNTILKVTIEEDDSERILLKLFNQWNEFRNLFYFRLRNDPVKNHFIYSLTNRLYPPKESLIIHAEEDIGPGLFIQHGTATGIAVQSIGSNCWINHHSAIGYTDSDKRPPIIGNNVMIFAGAKIYGDITISDDVIIGANSVVVKDVPPNCTIVGVPGRIIKRNGMRVDEPL